MYKKPKCYAYMADDETRTESSSGGIFPVLANYFLEIGGYVAGAVFDENLEVNHIISNKPEDIKNMRGSKYIQGNIGTCYKDTKELLDNNKIVLFTGTPCQIAGMKAFLKKDYDNLYCVDILCHGTPPNKVWKKYLNENFDVNKINSFKFRDKKFNGWDVRNSTSINGLLVENEDYLDLFLEGLIFREACFSCKYNTLPRQGDITIGDFWGINQISKKLNDGLGTSVLLLNNKKGEFLYKILKRNNKKIKKASLDIAIKNNPNISRASVKPQNYDLFWKNFDNMSLAENKQYVLEDKCDCMLLNFWFTVNYGAALTAYGDICLLNKMNLNAKTINFVTDDLASIYKDSFSEKFAKKYLNLTKKCNNWQDLYKLNKNCNNFITGSDQIWNTFTHTCHYKPATNRIYMLDFVKSCNRKISFASSFGRENLKTFPEEMISYMNYYFHQFAKMSVREDTGVEILKNEFNIDATHLIDGAFHIPKEKLEEMTKDYKSTEDYIAFFSLPSYKSYEKFHKKSAKYISEKLDLPIKYWDFSSKKPVEEWIAFLKNSKFVISDSYHAVICAIIFNIPFAQIVSTIRSQNRMNSLYRLLGIRVNPISKYAIGLNSENIILEQDWNNINKKIETEILKSEEWLNAALNTSISEDYKLDGINYTMAKSFIKFEKNQKQYKNLQNKCFTNILRNLFSVTNEKNKNIKRKVITILGIKIKIKTKG